MNEMVSILGRRGFLRGLMAGLASAPIAVKAASAPPTASVDTPAVEAVAAAQPPARCSIEEVGQQLWDLCRQADELAKDHNKKVNRLRRVTRKYKKIAPKWVNFDLGDWARDHPDVDANEMLTGFIEAREQRKQEFLAADAVAREQTGLNAPLRAVKDAHALWEDCADQIANAPATTLGALMLKAECCKDYPLMSDAIVSDLQQLVAQLVKERNADVEFT